MHWIRRDKRFEYKPAHPIVVGIRLQYSVTSSPATQAKHSAVSALQHGSAFRLTFNFLSKILYFFEVADTSKYINYNKQVFYL